MRWVTRSKWGGMSTGDGRIEDGKWAGTLRRESSQKRGEKWGTCFGKW